MGTDVMGRGTAITSQEERRRSAFVVRRGSRGEAIDPSHRVSRCSLSLGAYLVLVTVVISAASARSAAALSVTQTYHRTLTVAGAGCEQMTDRIALPVRTRSASLIAPKLGAALRDLDDEIVATVIDARIGRAEGRRFVDMTVQGAPAMCSQPTPDAPSAMNWEAELVVTARLRRHVQVYFPQVCCEDRHDVKPRRLFLGASFFLDRVRWRTWGGSTARGISQLPWNACQPSCAAGQITWIPARVVLSRPRLCNGVYQYLTVRYRMTRKPPRGSRNGVSNFGFRCD